MENKRIILLLSGGIDSTALLAKLSSEGYSIITLCFHYGQKHSIELEFAKSNALKYHVEQHLLINLDKYLFQSSALVNSTIKVANYSPENLPKGEVNTYVPFRNLVFISQALSLAETLQINQIYLAINKEDSLNFWDCKKEFIENINTLSKQKSIQVKVPFMGLDKKEIIQLAKTLKVDLTQTMTCYQPKGTIECGACLSCLSKLKALA